MIRKEEINLELKALFKFATVGAGGFVIDLSILYAFTYWIGLDPVISRALSIFISVIFTWLLNRVWAFVLIKQESIWREALKYIASRSFGAVCNLSLFSLILYTMPLPISEPVVATGLSSASTMLVNYTLVRIFIYLPKI